MKLFPIRSFNLSYSSGARFLRSTAFGLSIFVTQACQATGTPLVVEDAAGKTTQKSEKSADNTKVSGKNYSPIFYELKLSKNNDVCRSLISVVNNDLASSPYVDYGNAENFLQWELLPPAKDGPPEQSSLLAKIVVDIDNDGDREYLYRMRYFVPLEKQLITIFKNALRNELKAVADAAEQLSTLYSVVKTERKINNFVGEITFHQPFWLKELPEYSVKNPIGLPENAVFNIFKFGAKNYLVADTLYYDLQSTSWYRKNPWYILFSVSNNGQLNNTCILKRTR